MQVLIGDGCLVCGLVAHVVEHPEEDRPPLVVGLEWSARITTVGFEIGVPTLAGWWLDRKFATGGWVLIVGALVGVTAGCLHLIQMTIALTKKDNRATRRGKAKREN